MRNNVLTLALAGLVAFTLPACSCNNSPPENDAGVIIVLPDGGSCTSDPGCSAAAGSACDPAGSAKLGTCVDVGSGCLKVQTLVACPSTLQTCPNGATACTCPSNSCSAGATSCASTTSVTTCALDVAGGCGVFSATGVACATHQSCTGAAPRAACTCDTDPNCAAGAGSSCNALKTGTFTCTVDANACLASGALSLCASPQVCTGAAPASSCMCPAVAASPIAGGGCTTLAATACETGATNNVLTCTSTGGCNAWVLTTSCGASSLVCGNKSGATDCECAANGGTTYYADAVGGSATGALPYPTGIQSPAKCRFKTLTAALIQGNAAGALGTGTVIATGSTGAGSEVFDGETFPLNVGSNVTLTTSDNTPTPANYRIDYNDNTPLRSAVIVHDLGHLTGFTIQNVSGAVNSSGITAACSAPSLGVATVNGVRVNGKSTVVANPAMAAGVNLTVACDMSVTASTITGSGFGVRLIAPADATTLSVSNSTVDSTASVGVFASRGTLKLDTVNVTNGAIEAIRLAPNMGEVVFTAAAGVIEGNQREGLVILTGGTAASSATLTGTEIRNNGSTAGSASTYAGINTSSPRALTLNSVDVHGNGAGGLSASGGATVVVTGVSHFDNNGTQANAGYGANVTGSGTSITAAGTTFSSNRGAGVHVGGLAVGTFDGITVSGNGAGAAGNKAGAFEVENGTATINTTKTATVITGNVFNGIKDSSGSLVLNGTALLPIDVGTNGVPTLTQATPFNGAFVGGAVFTATAVTFHDNGSHGLQVANTGANGQPISVTNSSFTNNGGAGLRVDVSSAISSGANSLNVNGCSFVGNLHGLNLAANAGDVHAAFQTNTFSGASDTAILVGGTPGSVLNFTGNTVSNNKAVTLYGGQSVGGFVFTGVAPGTLTFVSNQIHHNASNQIVVTGTGTWPLSGTAGASCAPATANVIACYNSSPAASSSNGVVAIGAGVIIQANGNSWQNAVPSAGTDFSASGGATFSPTPPAPVCPASTIVCP